MKRVRDGSEDGQSVDPIVENIDELMRTKNKEMIETLTTHHDSAMEKMEETQKSVTEVHTAIADIGKVIGKLSQAVSETLEKVGNTEVKLEKVTEVVQILQRMVNNNQKEAQDTINLLNTVNSMKGDMTTVKDHLKVINPAITESVCFFFF